LANLWHVPPPAAATKNLERVGAAHDHKAARSAASGKNAAAGQNGGQTRSEIIAITDVAQWNAAKIKT